MHKKLSLRQHKISIIGAGRLGSALARHLHKTGNSPFSLISNNLAWLEKLSSESHPVNISKSVDDLHRESTLIFLCVPDQALTSLVQQLAQILFFDWQNTVILHCSGANTTQVLAPLARLGAATAAIHPIQTFPTLNEGSERFSGIYWGVEASPSLLKNVKELVHDLGGLPVQIPTQAKALYHLACVVSSNYLVTLVSLSSEILAGCGLPKDDAFKMMAPLIKGTLESLSWQSPELALTGPVSRGDVATIQTHLNELEEQLPHLVPVYKSLASETLRVAVRKGSVSAQDSALLMKLLTAASQDPQENRNG